MATENSYEDWLKEAKAKFPGHGRGGRLERFAESVKANPAFQVIDSNYNRCSDNSYGFDEVDGDASTQQFDEVDGGQVPPPEIDLLFNAARKGCVIPLLSSRPHLDRHVNYANESGVTALHVAAEYGNYEDVDKLLQRSDVELRADKEGLTPLHFVAAAIKPDPRIAERLARRMRSDEKYNRASLTTGNTALHLAADNEHASAELFRALKDIDPTRKNQNGETAFHVAAKAAAPDLIVVMLKEFAPALSGWEMRDIDGDEDEATLIEICARSGNAEAVELLMNYGAKISQRLLFQLVDESTKHPTKTDKLIGVYRTVADNCVLSDCLSKAPAQRHGYPRLGTQPEKHREKQRAIMSDLLLTKSNENFGRRSVIEHVIVKGDKAFLREIVNTPHVFKWAVDDDAFDISYDITDFIPSASVCKTTFVPSVNREEKAEQAQRHDDRNAASFLDLLTRKELEHLWQNTDVFQLEPFSVITRPICTFVQLFYFVMALIQLAHMIVFSVCFMPPYNSSLSNRRSFKLSANASETSDPSTANVPEHSAVNLVWLIWPTVIWLKTIITAILHIKCRHNWYEFLTSRLVFAPVLWLWCFSTFVRHHSCLPLTSLVYLFGWLLTLSFFTATLENASIFSFLLKEIIVRDILSSFGIVFSFVLVSFSSAIHLLRDKALVGQRNFFDTLYYLFASALTTGEFMENETSLDAADDVVRIHLMRAAFAVYLCYASIILLNLLISMMNNRYEEARKKARNIWTSRTVYVWMRLSFWLRLNRPKVVRAFQFYWNVHKYWKHVANTKYDEVSIANDGERIILKLKYMPST